MHRATLPLTDVDAEVFRAQGYLYIEAFFSPAELRPLQSDIYRLLRLLLEREGLGGIQEPFSAATFDSGLGSLMKKDRRFGGEVYEAVKKLPSHLRLATDPRHAEVAQRLLGSDFVGFASRGWGLRLDHPQEDSFLTQLHQEYISQICSPRGIVFWVPLRSVDGTAGPVAIYPGSHREGVYPLDVHGTGSYSLMIRNEAELEARFEATRPEVECGHCVVMDFLTLHKSSPNRSRNTRWAMLTRYFDFLEVTGVSIGWVGGIQEGNSFDKLFPELARRVEEKA